MVWAADYLPFGKANVTIGGVENNLRFAGQYYDQETGLHYNYHRYYDPKLGRYLRADPSHLYQSKGSSIPYLLPILIADPLELHDYVYVQNNPISSFDARGLGTDSGIWWLGPKLSSDQKPSSKPGKCLKCDWKKIANCLDSVDLEPCKLTGFYNRRRCESASIQIALCHILHCDVVDCCDK